jgi:antitoxin (DNA-binding transcriptional repressor) of toxin-antitoxin stability system
MSKTERTMSASEFKAKCLRVFDDLQKKRARKVTITKRGKPVAVILPPPPEKGKREPFAHGFMKGMVIIPEGFDWDAPILDEPMDAELGILHR